MGISYQFKIFEASDLFNGRIKVDKNKAVASVMAFGSIDKTTNTFRLREVCPCIDTQSGFVNFITDDDRMIKPGCIREPRKELISNYVLIPFVVKDDSDEGMRERLNRESYDGI